MFAKKRRRLSPCTSRKFYARRAGAVGSTIADLQLSVRARKCMVRLGITTIAELVRRTGTIFGMQNFGVTV